MLYATKSLPHSLAKPIVSIAPAWRKKVVISHFSTEPTGPERLSNLHRVTQCGRGEMDPEEAQEVQKEGRRGYGARADGVGGHLAGLPYQKLIPGGESDVGALYHLAKVASSPSPSYEGRQSGYPSEKPVDPRARGQVGVRLRVFPLPLGSCQTCPAHRPSSAWPSARKGAACLRGPFNRIFPCLPTHAFPS